jgi:hypothetical protein
MKLSNEQIGRLLLDYDPTNPQPEFFSTATEMSAALARRAITQPVPFPAGLAPVPVTPPSLPSAQDPLPTADVLIVTWTVAEAVALATILMPGVPLSQWFEYTHNVDVFIPKVTGPKAPFNDPKLARYYHSLGLYYPVKLVGKNVLCFKSGLHMDYDGPAVPLLDLWKQMLDETGAKFVITTGTGGAIGANVLLGDVVVAGQTVFHCTKQFQNKTFKSASYNTTPLTRPPDARITPEMAETNAAQLKASGLPLHGNGLPAFLYPGSPIAVPKIVTTDSFEFDNTTDSAGLQTLGNVCDMGDASLGLYLSSPLPNPPKWAAIRNASDPQMDGSKPPSEQSSEARTIYIQYGPYTTAASVLATWGVICGEYGLPAGQQLARAAFVAPAQSRGRLLGAAKARQVQLDPSHLLLQIAASTGFSAVDITADQISAPTLEALNSNLKTINVDPSTSDCTYRRITYSDEMGELQRLDLIHVRNQDAELFIGTYLYQGASLVAKEEFLSG